MHDYTRAPRFSWPRAIAIVVLTFFCTVVWLGVGAVIWIVFS